MADRTSDAAVQVRQLFDAKAAAWPSKYAPDGRLVGRLTRLVDAVGYHVPVGGNVLDLGCGTGELAVSIAASGMRTTGCDISPEMLRIAANAEAWGNVVNWVELEPDWRVLPFRAGAFDAVVASSVLEYVDDPVTVLRECHRVLCPAGTVLCTVPDLRHPVRWLERALSLVTGAPLVRVTGNQWPRVSNYLSYLEVSRQRHLSRWWSGAAARAGLNDMLQLADSSRRAPLRLLTFKRPEELEFPCPER